ncbi:LamG-like jellyroll fold domain-containing protein [Thermodesulfobacteriota bacterium]
MNRLFAAVSVLLCWAIIDTGDVKALCPEKMITYWNLNENNPGTTGYLDEVGGNKETICTVCPGYTTQGIIDQAQVFNGGAVDITVPKNTIFDWKASDSFSIEVWVKVSGALSDESVIIGRTDPATSLDWRVGISSAGRVTASLIDRNGSGATGTVSGSDDLRDDAWHHVVFVRDDDLSRNRLYVDGGLVDLAMVDYTAGFGSSTQGITIGWMNSGNGFYFQGILDAVALYSVALSEKIIIQHYQDGVVGLKWGYCNDGEAIKIMPLGDSITVGSPGNGGLPSEQLVGFRQSLCLDLKDADQDGITDYNIDFVGSQTAGEAIPPSFDYDHEGYSATTADFFASNVYDYLNNPTDGDPDVVLLHIGTNDISDDQPTQGIIDEIEDILDEIDRYSPEISVVLARIINRRNPASAEGLQTSSFNTALQTMAEDRIELGDKILVVDHEVALQYPGDLNDEVHPNPNGYADMSDVWYNGLVEILAPTYMASPKITSDPVTTANLSSPYIYDVDADGNESPQFRLVEPDPLPDNMAIEPTTGIITWTPASYDTISITVEAENAFGTDTQLFDISVGDPVKEKDSSGGDGGCFIGTMQNNPSRQGAFGLMKFAVTFFLLAGIILLTGNRASGIFKD